jgi:predicted DNA-binding transcriptional regulator AlpA
MGSVVRFPSDFEPLVDKRGLAGALGLSVSWVELHMRESGLPHIKSGPGRSSSVRFRLSEVVGWMERRGMRRSA